MLKSITAYFSQTGKRERERDKLLRPEFGYLFDPPTTHEWVSLDLEMTGLNPKTDSILSVGAVLIHQVNGTFSIDTGDALSLICRPPVMPSRDSIVIHGLRPLDVENGISYDEMLGQLFAFIKNRPLVGFCIDRDVAFLNAIVKPMLGVSLPNELLDVSQLEQHARQRHNRNPDVLIEPKHLNQLLTEFAIPRLPAHDALNDAIMTAMLFTHLYRNPA